MKKHLHILFYITIIVLCVVTRLPQLLSNNLILDGDECILGLMAKHIASLKEFPLFFYGQAYGFSLIECLTIIPFYVFAGITTISVKSAMLLLWSISIIITFKIYKLFFKKNYTIPFLLILILICSPSWAVCSMNAWGGYITAFLLSSILLYLLFKLKPNSYYTIFTITILFVLIYESQPLWVPGLVPFIIYLLYKNNKMKGVFAFLLPSGILFIFFHIYRQGLSHFYPQPYFFPGKNVLIYVLRIPYFLFSSLNGFYFSDKVQQANIYTIIYSCMFCLLIVFLCFSSLFLLFKRNKGNQLFHISVLAIVATLLITLFSKDVQPRYLLSITGYTLLSFLLLIQVGLINNKYFITYSICMVLVGSIAMYTFKDYKFSTMQKEKFGQLITYLQDKNIHYVYCYDYMTTYQIIFYSNEKIIARQRQLPGRYPSYSRQVDSALQNKINYAYICNEWQIKNFKAFEIYNFFGYEIVLNPSKKELSKVFEFTPF